MKTVIIIPVVIGPLGIVTKNLENYLSKIDFAPGIEPLQKTCLLGTARVLRKVLDYQQKLKDTEDIDKQTVVTLGYWLWPGSN